MTPEATKLAFYFLVAAELHKALEQLKEDNDSRKTMAIHSTISTLVNILQAIEKVKASENE